MARGTRERFRQWEERILPPSQGITGPGEPPQEPAKYGKPCPICGSVLDTHSLRQLGKCFNEAKARKAGTNADR